MNVEIRNTRIEDYPEIKKLCEEVYVDSPPWQLNQIESHLKIFPEGQFVAEAEDGSIVGMASSLIVYWNDYEMNDSWRDFTDYGLFTNHDPELGRTLYGAEIMVSPRAQGKGVGKKIYKERENLTRRLELLRIRAGARLRGYCTYANELSPEKYVISVIEGKLFDPTLSFQLKRGFHVLDVVRGYLRHDPESLGYAAVIEWLNEEEAEPKDYLKGNPIYKVKSPFSSRV